MRGYQCEKCSGYFDAGELTNNVCDDCRNEQDKQMKYKNRMSRLFISQSYQMELQLEE